MGEGGWLSSASTGMGILLSLRGQAGGVESPADAVGHAHTPKRGTFDSFSSFSLDVP